MDVSRVVKQLKERYPGKKIIKIPEDNPKEILCEIEPTSEHPDYSVAISVIDKSIPHCHRKTTEVYKIIKGKLTVVKDGKKHVLNKGDKLEIKPGETHYAIGSETWIKVYSNPGWILKDHILINRN
jgi:mannose-6-phosphate isomerase-like protein (cupin superfamily)